MSRLVYSRLEQNEFRLTVLSAYDGRYGVIGERVRPTLEAAHIKPYALNGPSVVTNGLSLRADIHKLFDVGYVTVDPTYRFRISPTVRSRFENGREYYQLTGRSWQYCRGAPSSDRARSSSTGMSTMCSSVEHLARTRLRETLTPSDGHSQGPERRYAADH